LTTIYIHVWPDSSCSWRLLGEARSAAIDSNQLGVNHFCAYWAALKTQGALNTATVPATEPPAAAS